MTFEKKIIFKFNNSQTQFPIEILNSWDLTELEIIGGNFSYFPEDISILKNLKRLTVCSSQISILPKEIFELPYLTYLNLKNNKITELPVLTQKSQIQTLILGRNYINLIDQAFIHLLELVTLDLSSNQLCKMPEYFYLLKKLQRLNFDSNKLKTIPFVLKDLKQLSHLSLENNLFSKDQIKTIKSVQRFSTPGPSNETPNRLQDIFIWNGRPEWDIIFSEMKESRQTSDIGVCFCGAAAIGADLVSLCQKYSSVKDECLFTLHKENF